MIAILVVAGLTLLGSFLCSLFEAVLYSITPSQLEVLRGGRRFGAEKLAQLRTEIEEPIAGILTVNTITHTVGAAACGAMVEAEYGSTILAWFTAFLTLAILLVTEIIPKSIGVKHASRLGPSIAWPLQVMIWSVWPIVKASGWLMGLLTGKSGHGAPTEDEVMVVSRLAAKGGHLRPQEQTWVENALRLDRVKAGDLITPRTVCQTLNADASLGELKETMKSWEHSRLPVTDGGDTDKILGMAYRREILEALVADEDDKPVRDLMRPIDFVPEAMPGHTLLDKFITEKKHLVGVVDEYGGFEGVVTLEDVLESLIGKEIVDEHDEIVDMQEFARQKAALKGR